MKSTKIAGTITIAILIIATLYMHMINTKTHYTYYPTPFPVFCTPTIDTEKEQLRQEIQVLRESNERLKWYMNTFYSQSQIRYMKARGSK